MLKDEEYKKTNYEHRKLWGYIVNHYKKEAQCPIVVAGYDSIPIAIELSQWGYPITFLTDSLEGVKKARKDCQTHAGTFKELLHFEFGKNVPRSRLVTFLGILEQMEDDEIPDFISMLLRRSQEVVCSVRVGRNWERILGGKFDLDVRLYNSKQFYLLIIRENERNTNKKYGSQMGRTGQNSGTEKKTQVLV